MKIHLLTFPLIGERQWKDKLQGIQRCGTVNGLEIMWG